MNKQIEHIINKIRLSREYHSDIVIPFNESHIVLNALTQQLNNGWIPVSSGRLPSTEEYQDEYGVLQPIRVTRKSHKEYKTYYDGKEWSDTFTGELFEDVIAWTSITKPYKEERDERAKYMG